MKIRMEKSRIAAILCAAVICIGGGFFCAHFYKNAPREIPSGEISRDIQPLPQISGGEEAQAEKTADESSSESDGKGEISEDKDLTAAVSSQADNGSNNGTKPQSENSSGGTDNQGGNKIVSTDIHSAAEPSGAKTSSQYFTASIKDGETVSESAYSFTITHLDKKLKVRDCTVSVNGEAILQFSGKCVLADGKNLIRISCSYTDENNGVIRAYKDYTVYLERGEISFRTDLSDTKTDSDEISFSAEAYLGGKKIPLTVKLNGKTVSGEGKYSCALKEGENKITLSAKSEGKNAEKSFSVVYEKPEQFVISTDLYDRTVQTEEFSFYCRLIGAENGKLTVQLNGKALRGEDGNFSCLLEYGENTIRIIGRDGENSVTQSYTVSFIPPVSEEEMPIISYVSISDGMTVKGSALSLTLYAEDCWGKRIYSDRISVICSGNLVGKSWEDGNETGYVLSLIPGENEVTIRLTDELGRTKEYYFTVNCSAAGRGEEIGRVQIRLDCSLLGIGEICSEESLPVYEGENGFDVMKRFLEQNGFTVYSTGTESGQYISRIERSGAFSGTYITESAKALMEYFGVGENGVRNDDSLGEFDFSLSSGWVYKKNGNVPSYGISNAVFSDGDSIELVFSLCGGNDIREGAG